MLLLTPDGPTLWHRHVLLFGSAARVWGYNRFGDAPIALARVLTLTPALHYVDDYGAIQPTGISQSSALPPNLLQKVSRGTNAIYFLEAWAALIAPVIFRPWLTSTHLQLCDNEAVKHAIRRGVGKHQPLNSLLGAHSNWRNRQQLQLHIARFSRHDKSVAHKHGWQVLQSPMHALHTRTCRVIGDIEFAPTGVGFDEMPEAQQFHQSHTTQCGQGVSTSREGPTHQ